MPYLFAVFGFVFLVVFVENSVLFNSSKWTIFKSSFKSGYEYSNVMKVTETPLCSNALFRRYYRNHHAFPPPGDWVIRDDNVSEIFPVLKPEICSFSWNGLPPTVLRKCFKQHGIRSMLMLGDSQGVRYSWGMMAILNRTFPECKIIKIEDTGGKKAADFRYFSDGDRKLLSRMKPDERNCVMCVSYQVICTNKHSRKGLFRFEFIGMHHLSETVMQVDLGDKDQDGIPIMSSFQEFIFRYHLQRPHQPDLIVVPPPVNHAKFQTVHKPRGFLDQIRGMKSLIDTWMPDDTRVVWLPGMAEHESARGKNKYVNKTWGGKLASEIVLDLNKILYEEMEPEFVGDAGKHFGFLDLFKATVGHGDWSVDGVHMKPFWYELAMSYVMETFCAE